ncbi:MULTISPECIES: 3-phosphoshikimate 1-carboxyvinyltransferase [Lentibacter]|jgi:3-phosphoshikimate 1-carboxyvinyltransferase|uniref:3-phosphoshikimate 1-carboxyvinyltransferase n=1 Tax=Lentibacter algarum TaxID=576131 RepID=A0A1H3I200_9RHOB|nr:3-phosphoshikimate 1-carboxyvinyltransferase [Lentibacter algarum]MCO4778079.1 3-phosphoshikimate 1-carboxyvinyltransferase [Lentibacter algarum]MCO4828388.1 3-phosphoshikimate 1-carboxyvinyltransferase [Lentibacter algarum]WIF31232.1 3-phosphoshikimate 1-carboxyvinyltransferase AroA [Lentibacter algarum]SDY21054.1 3-phosphoshikimate 1-carboxyvinyltransferase [Lentibacter algarum]
MSSHGAALPMLSRKCKGLTGEAHVPGDKSISHRSLILGAMSVGETRITGLLEGQDVLDTGRAMRAFGAEVEDLGQGNWRVYGVGVGGFTEPDNVIDCGNSGTGVRLIMGAMATTDMTATFTGDASLNSRPMARVTDPLALFGARAYGRRGGRLPMTIVGAADAAPVQYTVPVPSAQVKSAVLLAALNARGESQVIEREATRDHTERMLAGFGATIETEETAEGRIIRLQGQPELKAQDITVPRDPSSAAFPVCAAIITEGSDVLVPNIGLNPTRAGLFTTLIEMGADLTYENLREEGGEPVADLRAKFSPNLKGIEVPPARAASMIDEYPVLSVVAAFAEGRTEMHGVKELRVKESDRIDAMAKGLRAAGVTVDEGEDWWAVEGRGHGNVTGGATVESRLDHRIAMSFLILGMASEQPMQVDDGGPIATSFPIFESLMGGLGAIIERV